MYNAFWRHALFVQGQSFSVKSRNGCRVIRLGAGNDFRGPSVQALPHPSYVTLSRARSLFRPLLPSASYAGYSRGITQLLKLCSLRCWRTWSISMVFKDPTQPSYENGSAQALWDVTVHADSIEVMRANRINARIFDKMQRRVLAIETSCPWWDSEREGEGTEI